MTLIEIREGCGYPVENFNAMRQSWNALFGGSVTFPKPTEDIPYNCAEKYLSALSYQKANRPPQVIQGALALLEKLRRAGPYEVLTATKQKKTTPRPLKSKMTPVAATVFRKEPETISRETEEYLARKKYNDQKAAYEAAEDRVARRLSPWISGLTWVLNGLEMFFLIFGLSVIAGKIGVIVGLFLTVLGIIVLLLVRLRGSAAGYAVFAWFCVCVLGGWLVEYPATLQAIEQTGTIVFEGNNTYSGIGTSAYAILVTVLMSGSSFAGTFFRYQKARDNDIF